MEWSGPVAPGSRGSNWNSPDATAVGPVAGHPGGQQQGGDGLVEQEVVVDELLLLVVCHVLQGVVLPLQVPGQSVQSWGTQEDT